MTTCICCTCPAFAGGLRGQFVQQLRNVPGCPRTATSGSLRHAGAQRCTEGPIAGVKCLSLPGGLVRAHRPIWVRTDTINLPTCTRPGNMTRQPLCGFTPSLVRGGYPVFGLRVTPPWSYDPELWQAGAAASARKRNTQQPRMSPGAPWETPRICRQPRQSGLTLAGLCPELRSYAKLRRGRLAGRWPRIPCGGADPGPDASQRRHMVPPPAGEPQITGSGRYPPWSPVPATDHAGGWP